MENKKNSKMTTSVHISYVQIFGSKLVPESGGGQQPGGVGGVGHVDHRLHGVDNLEEHDGIHSDAAYCTRAKIPCAYASE